ncbi:MAG: helix-turn-helix domain-containing protein [Syntrophales bacterium]
MIDRRLKQIRLAQGLSLDQLVARMDGFVTKQALSKYERGKAKPSPVVLNRLASALGVKAAHLWAEPSVNCGFIAYRKGSGLAKQEQARVEAVVCRMLEERIRLREILQEPAKENLPVQNLRMVRLEDAEHLAKELRHQWGAGLEPIANLTATLEDHCVYVMEIEAGEKFDGLAAVARDADDNPAAAAVVSRKSLAGERQRLNLAHELAHLVLDVPDAVDEEKAAFRFAGAFLAPDETLYREVGRKRAFVQLEELILLKQRFGMSLQALVYRLHDLEIISDAHYRRWFMDINRLHWKKKEPCELPPEQPQWLKKSVLRAVAEGLLTEVEGKNMLGETVTGREPLSLIERRAFMKLPLEERRNIMANQAREIASHYASEAAKEELEAGDIVEY